MRTDTTLWKSLPIKEKEEYKKMILAFASLTKMFAQKTKDEDQLPIPIINSKYQETVFGKVFKANIEDIGNTSYDFSLVGENKNYLIGLKTFGFNSGVQKVSQFKAYHQEWTNIFETIKQNSVGKSTKEEINTVNHDLYLRLAVRISYLRNTRMESSRANIKCLDKAKDTEAVYHVLMPSCSSNIPIILVGEMSYDPIDISKIEIIGCTSKNTPTNFDFTDGKHYYRFTSADSQLLMNFQNKDIVLEEWNVIYAEDAYSIFASIADTLKSNSVNEEKKTESYSWSILNENDEVELFSGFNGFYAIGSKLSMGNRIDRIKNFEEKFKNSIREEDFDEIIKGVRHFLLDESKTRQEKIEKAIKRDNIIALARTTGKDDLCQEIVDILYRPKGELYIPLPKSRLFHTMHPDFFTQSPIEFSEKGRIQTSKADREFNLIFEPSGTLIRSFITEDWGKGIESSKKMSELGEWILRGVFQLKEYEPLTKERLFEVGLNGIRLYKLKGSEDIHLQFIWIDKDNPPEDYWGH